MRILDLLGTSSARFRVGLGSAATWIKSVSGVMRVRNAADDADAVLVASILKSSGDSIEINEDAAGTGDDHRLILARAATGMTGDLTLTLPANAGTAGYALVTDGAGNLSWQSSASATNLEATDTTTVEFDTPSPVAMFEKPANAVVALVKVVIDTPFDDIAAQLSVGVSGSVSKYLGANQVDLTMPAGTVFEVDPGLDAEVTAEDLIATLNAGTSTVGQVRILVSYVIPS